MKRTARYYLLRCFVCTLLAALIAFSSLPVFAYSRAGERFWSVEESESISASGASLSLTPKADSPACEATASATLPTESGFELLLWVDMSENSSFYYKFSSRLNDIIFGEFVYTEGALSFTLRQQYNGKIYEYASMAFETARNSFKLSFRYDRELKRLSLLIITYDGIMIASRDFKLSSFAFPRFFDYATAFSVGWNDPFYSAPVTIRNASLSESNFFPTVNGSFVMNSDTDASYSLSVPTDTDRITWSLINGKGEEIAKTISDTFMYRFSDEGRYTLIGQAYDKNHRELPMAYCRITVRNEYYFENDLSSLPFESITYINASGSAEKWNPILNESIERFQTVSPKVSYAKFGEENVFADLLIVNYGAGCYKGYTPTDAFEYHYRLYISKLRENNPNSLILLMNLQAPSMYSSIHPLDTLVEYNLIIEKCASDTGALLANVFSATAYSAWDRNDSDLIAGKVFSTLSLYASCLSISSGDELTYIGKPYNSYSEFAFRAAYDKVKKAAEKKSVTDLRSALWFTSLCIDTSAYNSMTESMQLLCAEKIIDAINSTSADDHESFNRIFTKACYEAIDEKPFEHRVGRKSIGTVVAIGDCSVLGAGATDKASCGWLSLLHSYISDAHPGAELINLGSKRAYLTRHADDLGAVCVFDLISALKAHAPDMIIISLGSCDIDAGVDPEDAERILYEYINALKSALPDAMIVVVGLSYRMSDAKQNVTRRYNSSMRKISDEMGCVYADVYGNMRECEWLLSDVNMLSDLGHAYVANTVYAAICCSLNQNGYHIDDYENELLSLPDPDGDEPAQKNVLSLPLISAGILMLALCASVIYFIKNNKRAENPTE